MCIKHSDGAGVAWFSYIARGLDLRRAGMWHVPLHPEDTLSCGDDQPPLGKSGRAYNNRYPAVVAI